MQSDGSPSPRKEGKPSSERKRAGVTPLRRKRYSAEEVIREEATESATKKRRSHESGQSKGQEANEERRSSQGESQRQSRPSSIRSVAHTHGSSLGRTSSKRSDSSSDQERQPSSRNTLTMGNCSIKDRKKKIHQVRQDNENPDPSVSPDHAADASAADATGADAPAAAVGMDAETANGSAGKDDAATATAPSGSADRSTEANTAGPVVKAIDRRDTLSDTEQQTLKSSERPEMLMVTPISPPPERGNAQGDKMPAEKMNRRRLSLIHAEPLVNEGSSDAEKPRGTALHASKGIAPLREGKRTLKEILAASTTSNGTRVSISGAAAERSQANFENKNVVTRGNMALDSLKDIGIGHACRKGLKPESPNQDDFFLLRLEDVGVYGVFDGHGPHGHDVSNFVQSTLLENLWASPHLESDSLRAMKEVFSATQRSLEKGKLDVTLSGCTGTVIFHRLEQRDIVVAHVGDSRAVLATYDEAKKQLKSVDLTEDHKPTLPREMKRITAKGGEVKRLEGDIPHRVFVKNKFYPGLAMSRAFGDLVAVQAGVICEPDVRRYELHDQDQFIVICSDGVWEFISSQQAVDLVHQCGRGKVQQAAEHLARESWNSWITEEGDVVDDITVEIIWL